VLRGDGFVATFYEMYVDESGSDDESPILCIAGYIFKKKNAERLSEEWGLVLKRYKVPYFRMSRCAHGKKPFDGLSKERRIKMVKALIKIIRKYMVYGLAVTVSEKDYYEIMPGDDRIGGAYTFCLRGCLSCIWFLNEGYNWGGPTAYFFESDHKHQSEANRIMNAIAITADAKAKYHYVAHTFSDKKDLLPLQAADLLAWLWFTEAKRLLNQPPSRERRKDLAALIEGKPYDMKHMSKDKIENLAKNLEALPLKIPIKKRVA
jgi:Protein of unknown function (DUF3800)